MVQQGYTSLQHRVEYFNDQIPEGWKNDAGTTHINPAIYTQQSGRPTAMSADPTTKLPENLIESVKYSGEFLFRCASDALTDSIDRQRAYLANLDPRAFGQARCLAFER